MRTIKFRAWYKHDNPPLKFEQETKEGEYCRLVYRDGEFEYPYSIEAIMCDNDWIVEQFTGLADKNGKEIYEGDIVKNKFRERYQTLVCYWNEINNGFSFRDQFDGYDRSITSCEVIGNINENKELLEKK